MGDNSGCRDVHAETSVKPDSTQSSDPELPQKRAGLAQVAKTLFFGLFAIGMKGTLEKDGARVTPGQIVVGAFIGGAVLVVCIILLVRVVLKLAAPG